MSGGALDYVYLRVEAAAQDIRARAKNARHRAFAAHLHKVSKALRDLEWVWSGDSLEGHEEEAIDAVVTPADILGAAMFRAEAALRDLTEAIEAARQAKN